MARVREFDPDETLDKAMRLFWRKGYAETSVRDLVRHTGVAHAGLYAAFGDKRRLYDAALDRYARVVGDQLLAGLEDPRSGRADIEAFFQTVIDGAKSGVFRNGCLMANTGVEFGDQPGPELNRVMRNFRRFSKAFEGALERAKARREMPSDLKVRDMADSLSATFHGLAVLSRSGAPLATLKRIVSTALRQLD